MKKADHLLSISSHESKSVMISNRISRETKEVIDEARHIAKLKGWKIDFESIIYEAHIKIIKDLS